MIRIHTLLVGQPLTTTDPDGHSWTSTILRQPTSQPVDLQFRGLSGDQVADTENHGRHNQAVCCHSLDHYAHWNSFYNLSGLSRLEAGAVGENWTLSGATEKDVCIGDVYRVGTARIQVSQPRFPCWKQERKVKIPGFLKETLESLRSGFYVRVLEEGVVQVGDELVLEKRLHPELTVEAINICGLQTPDPSIAGQALTAEALAPFWKRVIGENLRKHDAPSLC